MTLLSANQITYIFRANDKSEIRIYIQPLQKSTVQKKKKIFVKTYDISKKFKSRFYQKRRIEKKTI